MPTAGQGAAGGLWTHTPVDWAADLGVNKPATWPTDAINGSSGTGKGARPQAAASVQGGVTGTPGVAQATITWTTTLPGDSLVEYGTTTAYGNTAYNAAQVLSHSVVLTGLTSAQLIHYRVASQGAGLNAVSADATVTPT
ncbi:MAG TPA: fibronectin type III domain-containing protein [Chloroflexota bacterium]|nr:fibronectin type III domain-containing protein [Chloroflexota bacterium]